MKINHLPIILLSFFGLSSCNFLDETSPNDIEATTAIKTAANAENALTGLYSSLQNGAYYGGAFPLIVDALGDNCTTGGFDNPMLDEIGAKTVTPSNTMIENLWLGIYRTIANCNYLLEALPNIKDLDADRGKNIEGQARAIRAMAHFDLLRSFGYHRDSGSKYGIPIIGTVQKVEYLVPRAPVSDCYKFITDELEAALGLVAGDDRSVQFVNEATVHALLARVYLYEKNSPKAASHAGAVISDAAFSLVGAADLASVYNSRRTVESIFELSFDNQNRSDFNALTYTRPDALRTELLFMASPSLADFFNTRPGDVRAALLDYDPANHDESITSDGSGRTQKYRGEDSKDNPAFLLRLAEMYLIRAEANGLAGGLVDLNALRLARGLAETTPANDAEFEQAVLDERRAELNFEGHQFFDIARTGRAADVLGDDFRAALPVPLREVTATGGVVEQNPGY